MATASGSKRHALGLPPGSVRATHLLLVVGMICAMLLVPAKETLPIPPYLIYLLFMMIGHYFAHRSSAEESEHAPLYLPRGSIRFLSMLALCGAIGWSIYSDPDKLQRQFELSLDALKAQPLLPLYVLGGFFLGVIVRAVLTREAKPETLQDVQAWLSILCTVGLGVAVVIHLIIMPSLETAIALDAWEAVLAAFVAFYFGERS